VPKISELTQGTTPTGSEPIPSVQSGITIKLLLSQVLTYIAEATKTLTNTTFDTAGTGNSLSINGLAATANTGTGSVVRATSPTLVTPALGTPASVTLTNATGLPIATGVANLGTGVATFLTTPSSANLLAALTDETGTGAAVFATSPTLVTPALGTPASGTLTNTTGFPTANLAGAGSGVLTFLATPSSANLRSALTDETGTGVAVFATAPTLAQPVIQGITSGTPPIAGQVGQLISTTVSIASGVALTSGAAGIVWNSIALTAGIWLVGGNCGVVVTGGLLTHIHADHSTGTTLTTSPGAGSTMAAHVDANHANGVIWPLGCRTYDLSGNTTISSVITTDFSAGTAVAYGHLWGIRIA
jgi:hypothetical protein